MNKYDYPDYQNRLHDKSESNQPKYNSPSTENPEDVRVVEDKVFCTNCGNQMLESEQFCTNCGKSPNSVTSSVSSYQQTLPSQEAGRVWYLLPILLGFIGGIIAWAVIRNRNPKRARNCLIIGFLFLIPIIIMSLVSIPSLFLGTSEIDNALSEFPEQIQNIKQQQILNCENNMGYLQSYELGEMIKERCIDGVLGR